MGSLGPGTNSAGAAASTSASNSVGTGTRTWHGGPQTSAKLTEPVARMRSARSRGWSTPIGR
ncbi:Uncharacterised protein [Mycobacterium tuberculosis]|nr:Uncharacterised protein [Mycobacterium tuberculosis]